MSSKPHEPLPVPPNDRPRSEQRRSLRVACVISLDLKYEGEIYVAETQILSAHGALLNTTDAFRAGAPIRVTNPALGLSFTGRVISSYPGNVEGLFDVAIEFDGDARALWGDKYGK